MPPPPVNATPPTISGEPVFDEVLHADPGTWEPAEATYTYTYQWLRGGREIPEGTNPRYRLRLKDLGERISVRVTATDDTTGGTGTADSEETAKVTRAVMRVKRLPRVRGTQRFTHAVRATPGRWATDPTRVRYQWLRDGTEIPRATRPRYRFAPLDVGHRVRVRVTVRAPGHVWTAATSALAGRVLHRVDLRRTVRYHVETRGRITADLGAFRRQAQETYADPRGWRGAGIGFRPVRSGGGFTLVLAAANRMTSFSPVCSAMWSCRVGRYVVINQDRWKYASPAWRAARGSLRDYRHMVVNHETGHWLGHGHAGCPGPGRPAPVMMQQSKGLGGCRFNPWPTIREQSRGTPG